MTKEANINNAMKLAADMLKKLDETGTWSDEETKKLAQLTKVVNVLAKLMPMAETKKTSALNVSSKEDKKIIENFLKRSASAKPKKR